MKARTKLSTNDGEDLRMMIWKLSQTSWGWTLITHVPMKVRQNYSSDIRIFEFLSYHRFEYLYTSW